MAPIRLRNRDTKPVIIPEGEQCECRMSAATLPMQRCPKRGVLYSVTGHLACCFVRLCERHRKTVELQGFKLEAISPIGQMAHRAVAL